MRLRLGRIFFLSFELFEKLGSFFVDREVFFIFEGIKELFNFFGWDIFFGDLCHNLLKFGETAVEFTVEKYKRDFIVISDEWLHFKVEIL